MTCSRCARELAKGEPYSSFMVSSERGRVAHCETCTCNEAYETIHFYCEKCHPEGNNKRPEWIAW